MYKICTKSFLLNFSKTKNANKKNTNTERKVSFNLPSIIKDELEEYCSVSDRTQIQVLRKSIYEYLRYVREGSMDIQVG
jgi:hypothetical protein